MIKVINYQKLFKQIAQKIIKFITICSLIIQVLLTIIFKIRFLNILLICIKYKHHVCFPFLYQLLLLKIISN